MISKRYNAQMGEYLAKLAEKQNTAIGYVPPLKKTNADRIRAMTDEELANEYFYILHKVFPRYTDSRQGLLHYLKQEADNDP